MRMLGRLNNLAYDSTHVISWSHRDAHHYIWDKKSQMVSVKWDNNTVLLNLKEWNYGKAYANNTLVIDKQLDVLRGKAYSYFCNDSFWLVAPYKIFEPGVSRSIVVNEDKSESLLVSYGEGGVTPGDSYLWSFDENHLPKSYKMWVKIIPIGGVSATWDGWVQTKTGFMVATKHKIGPMEFENKNIKTGKTLEDIGLKSDIFNLIR
jgi:hypothetical protein